MYNILRGLQKENAGRLLPLIEESKTRERSLRINGRPFRTGMRRHFFMQRVVNLQKSLPEGPVDVLSKWSTIHIWILNESRDMGMMHENSSEIKDHP